jgi:SAM-dependent methyltransferase
MLVEPVAKRVAKRALFTVNAPLAKMRMRRAARSAPRPVALEIGGRRPREGWLVTDVSAVTRNYLDLTKRWPFEDGALSYVFADNVIEHVSLEGGRNFFAEAHRCLQPGGVLRVVTPDIGRHVEQYLAGVAGVQGDVGQRYRSFGIVVEHPVDLVRIPIGEFRHYEGYAYDYEAMSSEMDRAGFTGITERDPGESDHPMLKDLEQRQERGQAQLILEATR